MAFAQNSTKPWWMFSENQEGWDHGVCWWWGSSAGGAVQSYIFGFVCAMGEHTCRSAKSMLEYVGIKMPNKGNFAFH